MRPPRFLLPANTKHQNAPDPVGRSGLPNGLENGFPCVRQPHRHRRTGILSYGQKVRGSRTAYRHIPAIAAPPAAYIPTELPPMAR